MDEQYEVENASSGHTETFDSKSEAEDYIESAITQDGDDKDDFTVYKISREEVDVEIKVSVEVSID